VLRRARDTANLIRLAHLADLRVKSASSFHEVSGNIKGVYFRGISGYFRYCSLSGGVMGKHEDVARAFPQQERGLNMKLTTANVALPHGKADAIFFDDDLTGFGLRVRRGSGGRLIRNWIIAYRAHGRQRRMIIADATKVSAAEARKRARKELSKVELGGDPQGEKKERREKDAHTLRGLIGDFLQHKTGRPNTLRMATNYLLGPLGKRAKEEGRQPYLKSLHPVPIDTITRADIARVLLAVEKNCGVPTAISLRGTLTGLFTWAVMTGQLENSPMIHAYTPKKPASRDRVLSDTELTAIWKALEDDNYGRCVKLCILCGARREEIAEMRWSEFAANMSIWTLPKERSKTRKALTLPVTDMMAKILTTIPKRDNNEFLFGDHGFQGWSFHKQTLDAKLDIPAWQHRDLRRALSTRMNDLGIAPPHVIEAILGHALAGSHGVYNRAKYFQEMHTALALWSDHIRSLVEGSEHRVLAFARA
jgi:integrase